MFAEVLQVQGECRAAASGLCSQQGVPIADLRGRLAGKASVVHRHLKLDCTPFLLPAYRAGSRSGFYKSVPPPGMWGMQHYAFGLADLAEREAEPG